jgi:hypothetical protein
MARLAYRSRGSLAFYQRATESKRRAAHCGTKGFPNQVQIERPITGVNRGEIVFL